MKENQISGDKNEKTLEAKLEKNKEQTVVKQTEKKEITFSPYLDEICKGYEKYMNSDNRTGMIPTYITDKLHPTKEQIEEFSKILPDYKNLKGFETHTSLYLSALMQSSEDKEFTIDMKPLNNEGILLQNLAYKLKGKKLTINGNTGNYFGLYAEDCEITLNGNTLWSIGLDAQNCRITVNGDTGFDVGEYATKCEIYIKGNCQSLSERIGKETNVYQWRNNKWQKRVNPTVDETKFHLGKY